MDSHYGQIIYSLVVLASCALSINDATKLSVLFGMQNSIDRKLFEVPMLARTFNNFWLTFTVLPYSCTCHTGLKYRNTLSNIIQLKASWPQIPIKSNQHLHSNRIKLTIIEPQTQSNHTDNYSTNQMQGVTHTRFNCVRLQR